MIKESILMILLCCFAGNWAMAQDQPLHRGHHPEGPKQEMSEEMKTALNLTTEQRSQLDILRAETEEAMQALKQEEGSVRSAMRELHESKRAKFEEILTDDQLIALRSLRQAEHERRRAQMEQVDRKALREEMRNYHQEHIEPVMLTQRQKLETILSVDDQAHLANIRIQLKAAREEHNAEKGAELENQTGKHLRPDRGRRLARHKRGSRLSEKFPERHEALVAMVVKYNDQISTLLAELEPQKKQWKADRALIRAKYIPTELQERKRRSKVSDEDQQERVEKRELGAKIQFLLQDVDEKRD